MVDLSVTIGGLEFKNPVMLAAIAPCGPWTHWPLEKDAPELQMKMWRRLYEADIGGICTGLIFPFDNPEFKRGGGRFWAARTKGFAKREGFVSAASIPDAGLSKSNSLEAIRRAKKEFTDVRIIANIITTGTDPVAWGNLALECQQAGADMVEMNFGSAMIFDTVEAAQRGIEIKEDLPAGITIGLVPEMASSIVKGMKKITDIPVTVKLTPELSFFHLRRAIPMYKESGVVAFTANHCFMTVVPPDIYNGGRTTFPHMETTTWWTTNGPWHRFACYRNVAMLGKYFPEMSVMACGGLVTPEQCVEIMMLGAQGVQLSAGVFWNGLSYPGEVVGFLKRYMEEQGYGSVNDFIGLGQKYIVEMEECQREFKSQIGKVIAQIDREKCVGLSACKRCLDNWCFATYVEDDQPMVDAELCSSCNLCVITCPHGARSLQWVRESEGPR
jgi:dihydropyrimidine dehydrogenase (NAD+) subunit PreA